MGRTVLTAIGTISILGAFSMADDERASKRDWQAFETAELTAKREASGRAYLEFLRTRSLDMGVYALPAGDKDPQQPHDRDEVYYIVEGRAVLEVGDERTPVRPGSIVFVRAGATHRFTAIEQDLVTLVFFSSGPTG